MLAPITSRQKQYAYDHCFDNNVVLSRKTLFCLECGHSWKDEVLINKKRKGCTCPQCGARLKFTKEYKGFLHIQRYYAIVDVYENMQVVRMFCVWKNCKKYRKPDFHCFEVMQHWIDEKGKMVTLSEKTNSMGGCYDAWCYSDKLEVRTATYAHELRIKLAPDVVYPKVKVLPVFKRNGIRNNFHGIAPHTLILDVLQDTRSETLLKAGQFDMLRHHFSSTYATNVFWKSIKICIRNKYKIKDASVWCDYIQMLNYFKKDILNPFYACPKNLKKAHDEWMKKKQISDKKRQDIRDAKEREERLKQLEENRKFYQETKANFLDLQFGSGDISVRVLKDVDEFKIEGEELHHCVFTNEYYAKPDSLILSAQVNNQRTETVEISLDKLQVVQCRGRHNQPSEYHDKIVELVKNNLHQIAKVI